MQSRGTSGGDAKARTAYLNSLIRRAKELGLARTRMWQRLVHYRSGLFGWVSEADNRAFFLAAGGKSDPEAELEATLRGFFRRPRKQDATLQHPFCRFPARLAWLAQELAIDFSVLPKRRCPKYDDFRTQMRPAAATLVFSSYYLNNPASAFGHTFLRIGKKSPSGTSASPGSRPATGQELLDYGIDFSANVDTTNSLLYAIKGLTGMFPGTFRKLPYYFKVREYNDYESRDMWEYELELSQAQLNMLIAHIWELGSTHFDYYYLTENCSYHILAMLEVANPKVELMQHLRWPVIPADTVKALFKVPGMVRDVRFRPSNRTLFRARLEGLLASERDMLGRLAVDPQAAFPQGTAVSSKLRVLDAALDYLDYALARDLLKATTENEHKQILLERRAAIRLPSPDFEVKPHADDMPHYGHDTQRWGLGSGYSTSRGYFHQLDARLALHSLDDPAVGYPEHMQIEFLPTSLRYDVEDPKLYLEDLSLIRIVSLTPLDAFSGSTSWQVRVGATRIRDDGCDECLAAVLGVGGGGALSAFEDGVTLYLMVNSQVLGLGPIDGIEGLPLRAGLGPTSGLRVRWTPRLVTLIDGDFTWLPFQAPTFTWDANFTTRWLIAPSVALSAQGRVQPNSQSVRGGAMLYF